MCRSLILITACCLFLVLSNCSRETGDELHTVVKGNITVADSIDASGDFSGIELLIFKKDSANANADTLFYEQTDSTGYFEGAALFNTERFYPLLITRNGNNIGRGQIILSHLDTVSISAQLPQVNRTLSFSSYQHKALNVYRRVDQQFNRVAQFAQQGAIAQDSLPAELNKWGSLYWEVYERFPKTIAGRLAAAKSLDITWKLDYDNALDRIQRLTKNEKALSIAANYGKQLIADSSGLTRSIQFLDSLKGLTNVKENLRQLDRTKIQLLYDSAKVDETEALLSDFKQTYTLDRNTKNWTDYIGYDLENLAPGDTLPGFSITTVEGKKITRDSLRGTPFILEITSLTNELYKQQYDRSLVLNQIYQTKNLQFVTLPLDPSQVTIEAFFEARGGVPWHVANAESVDPAEILEKYNINRTPARFIVDSQGRIVKKLIGTEYQDGIQYIKKTITTRQENP